MKKQLGFTLIELMVAIAVVAVLLSLAGPPFASLLDRNRVLARTNQVMSSLALARSEAVKRKVPVTMCRSANGTACPNGTNWEEGWIIFTDINGDGTIDAGDGDEVLKIFNDVSGFTLRGNTNVANRVTYNTVGGTGNNGTLRLCPSSGDADYARDIKVSRSGRPRTEDLSSGDTCPTPS